MMAKNINEQININESEVHTKKFNLNIRYNNNFFEQTKQRNFNTLCRKSTNIYQRFKIENFLHIHPS
jgi:hypothetical protein